MALFINKGKVITEFDLPVVTAAQPKSVTVNVRTGKASVFLGGASGQTIVMEAGESMNWSVLANADNLEQMTVSAVGPGASVLVAWAHL